ncbi:MAG: type II toxin-antitoxin system PemK/MazF family toxin [Candidatus Marinimicrobia bacterium]|nr:type II toxin-antitoxin system PemK/MazF family toxin [Candidatus Neomarinimicrobiota bacterium]
MTYKKWDIVLIPFPFTDLSKSKKRPGLILSPDNYNKDRHDVVIGFLTSKIDIKYKDDYLLQDWQLAHLPKPTLFRLKFATILHSIIDKKIGVIQDTDKKQITQLLKAFFIST